MASARRSLTCCYEIKEISSEKAQHLLFALFRRWFTQATKQTQDLAV